MLKTRENSYCVYNKKGDDWSEVRGNLLEEKDIENIEFNLKNEKMFTRQRGEGWPKWSKQKQKEGSAMGGNYGEQKYGSCFWSREHNVSWLKGQRGARPWRPWSLCERVYFFISRAMASHELLAEKITWSKSDPSPFLLPSKIEMDGLPLVWLRQYGFQFCVPFF